MERWVLVVALGLWAPAIGRADDGGVPERESFAALKGRWAFDFLAPKKASCAKVDQALVKKAARAQVVCRRRKSEEAYDQAGGDWFTCEGKGLARAVFLQKEQCQSNLANERANGP